MKRWIKRPPNSNWGDFGPDDQIGATEVFARVLSVLAPIQASRFGNILA